MEKVNQGKEQHEKLICAADKQIREYVKILSKWVDYRQEVMESQSLGTTPPKPPKNPPGV